MNDHSATVLDSEQIRKCMEDDGIYDVRSAQKVNHVAHSSSLIAHVEAVRV